MTEQTYRIKPLEWNACDQAETPVGTYELSKSSLNGAAIWEWDFESARDSCDDGISGEWFSTREDAIANAQSDFEFRMLQGLEPTPKETN